MEHALAQKYERRRLEQGRRPGTAPRSWSAAVVSHHHDHEEVDPASASAAFLRFAAALRAYGSAARERAVAAGAAPADDDAAVTTVTAEWLYRACSGLPSTAEAMGGPLPLALAVVSACRRGDGGGDAELQAALFDVLGAGDDASMNLLLEVVPLADEIARLITPDALRALDGGSGAGAGAGSAGAGSAIGGDEDDRRRRRLREDAIEAMNEAAVARLALGDVAGGSGSATATHSVARASDRERVKEAKRAAKRAAAAVAAAREAGVVIDDDAGAYGGGFDVEGMRREAALLAQGGGRGLDGMTRSEMWDMQRGLLPEGTRMFHEESGLPRGTEREWGDGFEMVTIPARVRDASELFPRIRIADVMSKDMAKAFAGTDSLNPMQSEVFDAAFHSRENLLICAPTGAGKTNVAMLAVVAHFRDKGILKNETDPYAAYRDVGVDPTSAQFAGGKKVIYIAPMKALAQEVVEKFGSKLRPLKIIVRELTGDMQLSRAEAESADIIVTTPEKWDVVTRKGGDGSLSQSCGLLIIDEVHLLADERGAVIESVVARLHRLVESSQRQVRVVGLSATLPNYKDVAGFLRVDERRGLFYFGPEHRPVPLQQQFIGVTTEGGKKDRFKSERKMNEVCYDVVKDSLRRGYQVMVFVHSRKGTGATAKFLADLAAKKGDLEDFFLTIGTEKNGDAHTRYAERASKSRNRELANHFCNGMGIHHAGMLRPDRKLTEQMFADGAIKVLCCTATLAWGINLPAHTVVIKGTEVYNPEKGGNVDLNILDVQQIFGRAGRPQFDTSGEATLITTHDALARYLDRLVRQVPIESSFIKQLADHLNAEIVSGTVTNVQEASTWLAYTYMYVRMCKNPLLYGISADQRDDDPMLRARCRELVHEAAMRLDGLRMIRYHQESGNLSAADLGRVASHFYIRAESVATFNDMLQRTPNPSDAQLCHIICCAYEFENVKVRPDELGEVDSLKKEACPLEVNAPVEEFSGKCCVLLQAYISNARVSSFTLISDTNYIASNAGRVARALFEMCLKRGNVGAALKLLRLAKSVDKRLWWFQSPLRQFPGELQKNVFTALESRKVGSELGYDSFESSLSLLDMTPQEVGQLCHWYRGGGKVQRLVRMLPRIEMSCDVQTITRSILRFQVHLKPSFEWNGKYHGGAEGFWIWVEDADNNRVYHHEYVLFSRRTHPQEMNIDMNIPAFDPLPPQYFLRLVSDSWVGCEVVLPVSFQHLLLPDREMPFTDLLDLTPLPVTALQEPKYEQIYSSRFDSFNPIQTQLFHLLYHTDLPVLLGAPTGSGKTVVAELALLRMKRIQPKSKCIYIAPLKSLARERLKEWKSRFGSPPLNWSVLELTGETHHDSWSLNRADVLICTPEKWDLVTRGWRGVSEDTNGSPAKNGKKFVKEVGLLIIDEIHLLGEERGAVLEAIVSRTRYISQFVKKDGRALANGETRGQANVNHGKKDSPLVNGAEPSTSLSATAVDATRIMGLSTALANPKDLADWIGIDVEGHGVLSKKGLYNFRPSVRPIPMEVHVQGYPGRHYCPRMATMNKPCYAAIKQHSPTQPVIIFVASRRQTRLTALDLINYAAGDESPRAFLGCDDEYIDGIAQTTKDASLRHTLSFGIGLHHAGLSSRDRDVVETLFLNGDIRVLVATATLAWGVNLPAHLVIVKGTEYFDGATSRYVDYPVTDVLQMMGRAGRPQFDTLGIAVIMVAEDKKNFYKKFLYEPFPVESRLQSKMAENFNAEISAGTINSVEDAVGYLTWTYYARRVKMNPSFYGAKSGDDKDLGVFFLEVVHRVLTDLEANRCVKLNREATALQADDWRVTATTLGRAASNFYLNYRTPLQMQTGVVGVRRSMSQLLEVSEGEKRPGKSKGNGTKATQEQNENTLWLSGEIQSEAICRVLLVLSFTHEFDELPVRHNEEELNSSLCSTFGSRTKSMLVDQFKAYKGLATAGYNEADLMGDPHSKCFLLIMAYLSRAKLPISDYINDTKSVLDQLPRLLAAMQFVVMDSADSFGSMDLICIFAKTRQVLKNKRMPDLDPLYQIPGLQDVVANRPKSEKSVGLLDLRRMDCSRAKSTLRGMMSTGRKNSKSDNRLEAAVAFLASIPVPLVENENVSCTIDKQSGISTGVLKFDLLLQRGRKASGSAHGIDFVVVLGTPVGRRLLTHKSVHVRLDHNSRGTGPALVKKALELTFDWAVANSGGGQDGGTLVLRILSEDFIGVDEEMMIHLR